MIVDTSAILSIFFREDGFEGLVEKLANADLPGIGTPTLAETGIVLEAKMGQEGKTLLERFLQEFDMQQIPFGEAHWREAVVAYRRFGKGRHEARLNFGDCLTYAVAKLADQPLLFVGDDFTKTDIPQA